ncbi:hypothetical protein DIX58_01110 [Streptococcus iniae]|nr:hypothetical protein DIX58_01110 [Streptococcus iniae]
MGNSSISDEHVFFVALHFTTRGYKVDDKSLDYNPMGGMFVNVVINNSSNLYMSFNLVEEDNKLDYANVVVSGVLLDKLGEPK